MNDKKYIDVERFLDKYFTGTIKTSISSYAKGMREVFWYLTKFPAADVQEVRHGKWIKDIREQRDDGETYDYCCSLCKGKAGKGEYNNDLFTDFVPTVVLGWTVIRNERYIVQR